MLVTLPPIQQLLSARPSVGLQPVTLQGGFAFPAPASVIIDMWSGDNSGDPYALTSARAFNVAIVNSAGGAQGPAVLLTCPGASRVCLYGQVFTLTAYNLQTAPLTVNARAYQVESPLETANVIEWLFSLPGAGTMDQVVPPFAKSFRFDVPASQRASAKVTLVNPLGNIVGEYSWAEQPDSGIVCGGISILRFSGGTGAARATFSLQV